MTGDEIREAFLRYFESKGHLRVASSSLVPVGDPTLLLTNAGMVQFKPYFSSETEPPNRRLTTAQKSFRTVDIDEVGDSTHLTLFEMLGNFSIGDYFKDGAMEFAVECLEEVMGLPRERFAATVHETDDDAFELWQRHGIPAERVFRFGDEENWWGPPIHGAEGPCGPCAELHYDFGDERPGCGLDDCGPNCANLVPDAGEVCQRYVELWNLVFMQFYHHPDGSRTPLTSTGIDTGMGFERLAAVLQGVDTFYETDLFRPLIARVEELSGRQYGQEAGSDYAIRVVAEHARSATFLIADGVVPGNEGRGYVLRRVIRRAIRHGRRLGLEDVFLGEIAEVVIENMGGVYPELRNNREFILTVLRLEEERFQQVFDRGLGALNGMISYRQRHGDSIPEVIRFAESQAPSSDSAAAVLDQHGFGSFDPDAEVAERQGQESAAHAVSTLAFAVLKELESNDEAGGRVFLGLLSAWSSTLSASEAFFLHDTYGFPVEVTQEIAREQGVEVDLAGFEREMEAQRERARASARFGEDKSKIRLYESLGVGATTFLGYEQLRASTVVVGLLSDGRVVSEANEGVEVEVVLQQTPFYPEGGGQVGDGGQIVGAEARIDVHDTQTVMPGLIVHFGKVTQGGVSLGDTVEGHVEAVRRQDTARNHTATHLLHAALRQVLGPHVRQAGSLVAPDRLRFDFSHVEPVTGDQLEEVQWLVNEKVRQNATVHRSEDAYTAAINRGALAFFGDKYEETVRLVEIANGASFSFEVCGGTHVERTGELGSVYILGESSIGAGMRRIEAVSGRGAERVVRDRFNTSNAVASLLQAGLPEMEGKVRSLLGELDELRGENEALERRLSLSSAEGLLEQTEDVDGVPVLAAKVTASSAESMRDVGDWLRDKLGVGVVVLGSVVNERPLLIAMVTAELISRGLDASEIAQAAAKAIEGGGGGRPDVAQAGGRRADKLDDALAMVPSIVREQVAAS